MNLRSGPSLQSSVIRQLNRGETYEVWGEQDGWLCLGTNQWVYNDPSYIQYKHYVATITGDNVNLRDAPSLNGNVIRQLHQGEAYRVWSKQDGWLCLGTNQWIYYIRVIFSMVYNRVKIKGAPSEVPLLKIYNFYKVYIETIVYYSRYIYKK